jgi:hypothetical protein
MVPAEQLKLKDVKGGASKKEVIDFVENSIDGRPDFRVEADDRNPISMVPPEALYDPWDDFAGYSVPSVERGISTERKPSRHFVAKQGMEDSWGF